MSDFGSFIGKVAGKVMNVANSDRKLLCYGCNEITDHISISYADVFWPEKRHPITVSLDYLPFFSPLVDGNPYACTKCKKMRLEGGYSGSCKRDLGYLK